MRAFLLIFSAVVLAGCGAAEPASTAQTRIVSTSLCGDSYLLSLAPHGDIAALSWQSADALSGAPTSMRSRPKAWDDPERLLALRPTLVIFGPGEGTRAGPLLDKAGIKHVSLVWGEDFKAVFTNRDIIGKAANIKTPQIGVSARLARTRAPRVLYLSSSGGTAGTGTFVDAAITRAGGTNIITKSGWHTPSLEMLSQLNPDLIVTSFFNDGYASVNEAGLRSKALQNMLNTTPHVNVPGKLWPCAGPGLYEATDIIYEALREVPDE